MTTQTKPISEKDTDGEPVVTQNYLINESKVRELIREELQLHENAGGLLQGLIRQELEKANLCAPEGFARVTLTVECANESIRETVDVGMDYGAIKHGVEQATEQLYLRITEDKDPKQQESNNDTN